MRLLLLAILPLTIVACTPGSGTPPVVAKPSVAPEEPAPAVLKTPVKTATPEAAPAPSALTSADSSASPSPEAAPEPCDGGWTCVKVAVDAKTIERRATKLIGDPKIDSAWSKWSDGRVVTFDGYSQGPVDFMLRRKPNDKNELVMKPPAGGEIIFDRHDGSIDDFTHVDFIVAEQHGALLVDFRYSKF